MKNFHGVLCVLKALVAAIILLKTSILFYACYYVTTTTTTTNQYSKNYFFETRHNDRGLLLNGTWMFHDFSECVWRRPRR